MSLSFHLYQLQKIDTQIDQGKVRIHEISRIIESDPRLADAQLQVEKLQGVLKLSQSDLGRIERDTAAKRLKLEQSEAALYGGKVKIPKELQDLQHEVASLKKVISGMEDQQLDAMVGVEEAQSNLDTANKIYRQVQSTFASEHAVLTGESDMLGALRDRMLIERSAIINQIDPTTLGEYERLRKAKRGMAVAAINEDSCSACGTQLTAAERQASRSPSILFHCPSCGRFLYGG